MTPLFYINSAVFFFELQCAFDNKLQLTSSNHQMGLITVLFLTDKMEGLALSQLALKRFPRILKCK